MSYFGRVLSIAGSDSGGGAGIQADIKTISTIGCYATTAITAVTVQNTLGVFGIQEIPSAFVLKQVDAVLSDIGADAIKIGMIGSEKIILELSHYFKKKCDIPIVLDPVMVATSGDILVKNSVIRKMTESLFPLASLITPNVGEACILAEMAIQSIEDMYTAAKIISKKSSDTNVLVKGGEIDCVDAIDILYLAQERKYYSFVSPMLKTKNTHGTGCSYSSAIASYLAIGHALNTSIEYAKNYIFGAIHSGSCQMVGKGRGPIDHFWKIFRPDLEIIENRYT